MRESFGYMNLSLSKHSIWIVLGILILTILVFYQNLFTNDLNNDRTKGGQGWSMEYDWAVQVAEGTPLYPNEPSFIEGQTLAYMPIYFLVVGNLMKVLGTSAAVGNVVSTLAALGIALLIYKMGVKLTGRRLLSILPGVLFLIYPSMSNYSSEQMKIDILALFFVTLSLYLVLDKKYLWSVPFAVLAFFTKQYYIALPITVMVYLLWKERRALWSYLGLYSLLIAIGFGIGQYLTGGTFFRHVVLFMFQPQFGEIVPSRIVWSSLICLAYLLPVLALAVYGLKKSGRLGLLGTYLVVSLLLMVVTLGKTGSGINYTFEPLVIACCLSSLVLVTGRHSNEVLERNPVL